MSAERRDDQEGRGPEDGNRAEDDRNCCLLSPAFASGGQSEDDGAESDDWPEHPEDPAHGESAADVQQRVTPPRASVLCARVHVRLV